MAGFATLDSSVLVDAEDIAELDRQWTDIESGAVSIVPHEKVARWLREQRRRPAVRLVGDVAAGAPKRPRQPAAN